MQTLELSDDKASLLAIKPAPPSYVESDPHVMVDTEVPNRLVTPLLATPLLATPLLATPVRVCPLWLRLQFLPALLGSIFVVDFLLGELLGQVEVDTVWDVLPGLIVYEEVGDHDDRVGEFLVFRG